MTLKACFPFSLAKVISQINTDRKYEMRHVDIGTTVLKKIGLYMLYLSFLLSLGFIQIDTETSEHHKYFFFNDPLSFST